MESRFRFVHRVPWACLLALAAASPVGAQAPESFDTSAGNLVAVLRPSAGANQPDEVLRPMGKTRTRLEDGREIEVDTSWYHFVGDMHIRLVFDGERSMQSVSADDLARLRLSPQQALDLAVANLRRRYGGPSVTPGNGGLVQVRGASPDLDSSYFLDRDFWRARQREHPEGVVVAVPRRGGLVFAPLSDAQAVAQLRFGVALLHAGGDRARLSSALYLFKDGRWSVFQPPLAP